ncbi:MAG: hypothetical protein NWR52_07625, partial [Paracoccaceae bacterium]|nr:hypothetical protein [Paracoccaceae bacterium]
TIHSFESGFFGEYERNVFRLCIVTGGEHHGRVGQSGGISHELCADLIEAFDDMCCRQPRLE